MDLTPSIRNECVWAAHAINNVGMARKHRSFAIFLGNFGLRRVRASSTLFEVLMEKIPDRLIGIYEPGCDSAWIMDDIGAMPTPTSVTKE
jgi:hypothetical protein